MTRRLKHWHMQRSCNTSKAQQMPITLSATHLLSGGAGPFSRLEMDPFRGCTGGHSVVSAHARTPLTTDTVIVAIALPHGTRGSSGG